ncbi:MAG: hypothetical protein PHY15_01960 [Eubacteriales bacterium]|nr:hypothetical protein [Eubacteriales bacterium]MDD4475613.1 hypothetical protein [Eubacteriales bacterium]
MKKIIMFSLSALLILSLAGCLIPEQSINVQGNTNSKDTSSSLAATENNSVKLDVFYDQKEHADSFDIQEDENGLKTIITENGKLTFIDLLHEDRWSQRDIFITSEKLIRNFESFSNDKMFIRGKKVSSMSYYAEDIYYGKKHDSCLFTISEIEVLEIIEAKFVKKNVKVGDIIKIYEGYAFVENENGELVSKIAAYCSRPIGDTSEYFISVYYTEEQKYIYGNPKEHFGNVLDGVWAKGFTRPITSEERRQELEEKHFEKIEEYKAQGKSTDSLWLVPDYYRDIKEYFMNNN